MQRRERRLVRRGLPFLLDVGFWGRTVGAALLALLVGCSGGDTKQGLGVAEGPAIVFTHDQPSEFDLLPGWRSELKSQVIAAFAVGCPLMTDHRFDRACAAVSRMRPGDENAARLFFVTYFRPVSRGTDYMTGYFEISVQGSRTQSSTYPIPVLAAPRNPQEFARPDIMAGALAGQRLEILYLKSEADLYFLQLQGAGRVTLPDGSIVRLSTAADNGRPRIPTEHLFGEAPGLRGDLSIPSIRAWAAEHPPEANGRIARDQTYVFLREHPELPKQYGPYGALTLPLLPLRSVAVDTSANPLGEMLWINTNRLDDPIRMPHLVIAQDTGALIQGPAKLDLFYGWGADAERLGGHEYAKTQVWALVPR